MKHFPSELQHGSGNSMTLDPTRLLLAFKEPRNRQDLEALLRSFGLGLEDTADRQRDQPATPFETVNHTDQRFWVRSLAGNPIDQERYQALENTLANDLDFIAPVYRAGNAPGRGGLLSPLPNVLMVRPAAGRTERDHDELDKTLQGYGLHEVREKSQYLGEYRYFVLANPQQLTAYQMQNVLREREKDLVREARFENMPMLVPTTNVPNDVLFPQQWSMTRIQAGGPGTTGWDISAGAATVVVCVLDQGCDRGHPDLAFAPGAAGNGINLGTMMAFGDPTGPHGTACAGLAAATFNNAAGVSGVAGNCRLMPVAFQNWTDAECAAGINWAAANGASVISMSFGVYAVGDGFGPTGWDFTVIDPAITNAVNVTGCVLVAATGNENTGVINRYPGRHPLVMAVGGSDQADNRKTPASADGECWGANFGPGISVVAPCVLNPTTDIRGAGGYNTNNGGARMVACVNYATSGDAAGDYFFQFNGTSAATPHVAGLAAAIRSQYPALTNLQVRALIERTADKVGGAYADAAGFPNGPRNAQMGYGRINMFRALDQADLMIRDWTGDAGSEPSTPPGGNFWTFSDIVVRITDDNVFMPGDPGKSSNVERGQTNYLYMRVTNNGPRDARNVVVSARITPYVGLEFVYPVDWTDVDANHVSPTPVTSSFATIPAGGSAMAKFTISAAQVEALWGWISGMNWHPCLLGAITADNDYAFASASVTGSALIVRRNNLAQRNLSVIDVLASAAVTFPFLAGNLLNADRAMTLVVDRSRLAKHMPLLLALDDDGRAFPQADLGPAIQPADGQDDGLVFLERTRVETTLGCCRGVLTLEKGSRFDCRPATRLGQVTVRGGEVILRGGRRFVDIRDDQAVVQIEKPAHQLCPLSLQTTIPADAEQGQSFMINVAQRNGQQETVGGACVVYMVK